MPAGRRNLKNNWSTTLQADAAATATTLSLLQAWIDKLTAPDPSSTQWYELTLDDGVQAPEIVRCTGKGTGTVTVVRAQQGTTAPTTWATGTKVEIRMTAELARVLEFASWGNNNWTMGELAGADLSTGQNNWLLGRSAGRWLTTGSNNTATGGFALEGPETGSRNTADGYQALSGAGASASDMVGVGYQAGLNAGSAQRSVYIGATAEGPFSDAVVIGYGAIAHTANTGVIGSPSSILNDIYIGGGQRASSAATSDVTLHATCGQGSNIGGADLRLAGGSGTGTGVGGKVLVATAAAGSSGSTENALTNRAEWDSAGLFWTYAGLKTGDPGAGAGTWKLGTVQAGAVTLDTANYVEVDIGGTVVKLLKAA